MPDTSVVVGVDGGGTFTRAAVADLRGTVLGSAESGGANPQHAPDAERNVQATIVLALHHANRSPEDVIALVAGIAGLDRPEDATWADRFTAVPGIRGPRIQVNDAVIAHSGALLGKPGILAIAGTGSIVLGITETGRQVRNYDFANYAPAASRQLGYEALFRIVAGEYGDRDLPLVEATLQHWSVTNRAELAELVSHFSEMDRQTRNYRAGDMGPLITKAAREGSPLARAVCDEAAKSMAIAIRLVATCFRNSPIEVAFIGSVIRDPYISALASDKLRRSDETRLQVVEPRFSAVGGALLIALQTAEVPIDARTFDRLGVSPDNAVLDTPLSPIVLPPP